MAASYELLSLMESRRSIRRFFNRAIDEGTLSALIEAASWAPSAGNRQDWHFTVVQSAAIKATMAQAVRDRWKQIIENNRDLHVIQEVERHAVSFTIFASAPVVIVVSARKTPLVQERLLGKDAFLTVGAATSAAMAAQNLLLAAHALGLGGCCMTGMLAASDELARILDLDGEHEIICLLTIGYPDEAPLAPKRKPLSEIMDTL